MKLRSIGISAIAALLIMGSQSFASDSEKEVMAKAMSEMKQEMDALRSEMSARKESLRESAGGAPEALRSNAGNATIRIGGSVIVRYDAILKSNNNDEGSSMASGGEYSTQNGWKMDTASVTFNVQINEDLSAFIDIRPSSFDKAYFQWNNIGGSGLGTQIGYIGIPGGMYSASWSPTNSVLIQNPVTKDLTTVLNASSSASGSLFDSGISNNDDLTEMGVKVYYELDQFKITASIFNNGTLGSGTSMGGLTGNNAVNSDGEIRNGGINHTIMVEYNPAFLEGLHFSATYSGQVDLGQGNYSSDLQRGTSYAPEFDLGVAYVGEKFSAWLTGDVAFSPLMFSNSFAWSLSTGANYNVTEKFSIGAGFDFAQLVADNDAVKYDTGMVIPSGAANDGYDYEALSGRLQVGAKYVFCNGVWVRGSYAHTWYGNNIEDRDQVRGRDQITLETGVSF